MPGDRGRQGPGGIPAASFKLLLGIGRRQRVLSVVSVCSKKDRSPLVTVTSIGEGSVESASKGKAEDPKTQVVTIVMVRGGVEFIGPIGFSQRRIFQVSIGRNRLLIEWTEARGSSLLLYHSQ